MAKTMARDNEAERCSPVVSPLAWFDKLLGFSYPPYDAKYRKYMTVNNSLGFQRGETLEY